MQLLLISEHDMYVWNKAVLPKSDWSIHTVFVYLCSCVLYCTIYIVYIRNPCTTDTIGTHMTVLISGGVSLMQEYFSIE